MRMMIRITLPTDTMNTRITDGSFQTVLQNYVAEFKPEAVYFVAENGVRTMYMFADMASTSQLPAVVEPPFLAYEAAVDVTPAMNLDDLKAAMPHIQAAVTNYAAK